MATLVRLLKALAGFRENARSGSNIRRFLTRLTALVAIIIVLEMLLPQLVGAVNAFTFRFAVLWSFVYLTVVVIIPVLLLSDRDFQLNPIRLFQDIMVSGVYCILAFGLLYRRIGYAESVDGMQLREVADAYYFSAVTFSTLGFGDFRPIAVARGYAAIQGIWGNIHLGLLAGAVFYAISANRNS